MTRFFMSVAEAVQLVLQLQCSPEAVRSSCWTWGNLSGLWTWQNA